jgi:hypothetical protein
MNLSALYKRLEADGIDEVQVDLRCDDYHCVEFLDVSVCPVDKVLSDDVLPLDFVGEVLGKPKETSLWELVEEVAEQIANDKEVWSEVTVTFDVSGAQVRVEGWDKRKFKHEEDV